MSKSVIVVGAGMGGLSAAIHARLKGCDVLVLEQGESVGGKAAGIKIGDYALDPGPSIVILKRTYEELFQAAGRKLSDYLTFDPLPSISRVFFEGTESINLPSNESACLDILKDLDQASAVAMKQMLDKVAQVEPLLWQSVYARPFDHPTQLLNPALMKFGLLLQATRPYRQLIDEWFKLPLLRAFFYGFPSYGGQTYSSPSPGSLLIPYYMLREGVYSVRGGVRAIPKALEKLAIELGVEIRCSSMVTGVRWDQNRVKAVQLADGTELTADAFLVNRDRFSFAELLGRKVDKPASFSYFTAHYGLRKQFENLEHHNIFIPQSFEKGFDEVYRLGRFPSEPIVYVNSTKAADPEGAPDGCSNLFAVVTCPSRSGDEIEESEGVQRIRTTLRTFELDWSEAETDFQRVQSPRYFEETHGNYQGSLYGLAEAHRQWGMFPWSNRDSEIGNLAYCGGSVQPGAGLPMALLSGKFAVDSLNQCLR